MKRYYLGLNAGGPKALKCFFTHGASKDLRLLSSYLSKKYQGAAILTKNGRSALCLALKSYFDPGDKIIVNGFTCYAVYEAVKEAGMTPIFADITKTDLNFDVKTLEKLLKDNPTHTKGIIIQNTLGNPVDIAVIEKFAEKHNLVMVEDLAHSAGIKYSDGRMAGTVGDATVFSFGKDKAINTISGGAVVLRNPTRHEIEAPFKLPKISEYLRARFYPIFSATCRGLNHIHLGGALMRGLIKIHWVEKSADSRLSLNRRPLKFQAKMALDQFKNLRGSEPLREFYLVRDRTKVLRDLREAGYYFDSFWYEKPVSPMRYYKEVGFPEKSCPTAVEVADTIINLPIYYSKNDLLKAREIIKPYLINKNNTEGGTKDSAESNGNDMGDNGESSVKNNKNGMGDNGESSAKNNRNGGKNE